MKYLEEPINVNEQTWESDIKPVVSIACITYNHERYLRDTIEGFLMQETTFPFEIIIHDDASTDKTANIINEYKEQFPKLFVTIIQNENQWSKGGGSIYARFVYPKARGKYVALCEGDDYWTDPYKLQKQFHCLNENTSAVACVANASIIYENTNESRLFYKNRKEGLLSQKEIMLGAGGVYATASLFFDKDEIQKSMIFKNHEEFIDLLAGDTVLIYALSEVGEVYYMDEVMSVYRRWDGGVYSSIVSDKVKLAQRQMKQLDGLLKLRLFIDKRRKIDFLKKISNEALKVVRISKEANRFKYLKHFTLKTWIKLFLGLK